MSDLQGVFDIEFVGGKVEKSVHIKHPIMTMDAVILWLEDKDGKIYNWTTIIKMERVNYPSYN